MATYSTVFLPGESHGQRSLEGYSPWGSKRFRHNWVTKHAHTQSRIKYSQTTPLEGTLLPSSTSQVLFILLTICLTQLGWKCCEHKKFHVFFTDVSQHLDVCLTQSEHFLSIKNCPKMNEILKTMGIKPNNLWIALGRGGGRWLRTGKEEESESQILQPPSCRMPANPSPACLCGSEESAHSETVEITSSGNGHISSLSSQGSFSFPYFTHCQTSFNHILLKYLFHEQISCHSYIETSQPLWALMP